MLFFFKLVGKLFKFVLMLTGILSFTRCGSGYKKDGDKVLFDGKEVSPNLQVLNKAFAKDDSTAYYKKYPIPDADIATFTAVDENYAKDKTNVYFCDEYREGQNYYLTKKGTIKKIRSALSASFTTVGSGYAKDKQQGFFEGNGFDVEDPASLTLINSQFVRDNVQAYFEQRPVKGSDGKSFRIINNAYAADTSHIYFYGYSGDRNRPIYILPCHKESFTVLEYPFSKDQTTAFYMNRPVTGADTKSFITLEYGFSKDAKEVFFEAKKISGADVASFTVIPEGELNTEEYYYAKDQTAVYWKDKKMNAANPITFKVLGHGYSSDDKHVFYKASTVVNADPASFKSDPYTLGDADAEDKNNQYSEGSKVKQ